MKKGSLQMRMLDERLKTINRFSQPKSGWITLVRNVLGMTKVQLAKKLNVTAQRLGAIEKGERDRVVKIKTLENVAHALHCNLYYCFVPKHKSFEKLLEAKIDGYIKKKLKAVQTTMKLEGQGISQAALKVQGDFLKKQLYTQKLKEIWDD